MPNFNRKAITLTAYLQPDLLPSWLRKLAAPRAVPSKRALRVAPGGPRLPLPRSTTETAPGRNSTRSRPLPAPTELSFSGVRCGQQTSRPPAVSAAEHGRDSRRLPETLLFAGRAVRAPCAADRTCRPPPRRPPAPPPPASAGGGAQPFFCRNSSLGSK